MPDWLTHVVIGLVLIEIFPGKKKSLILLGALLPDLLSKVSLLKLLIYFPFKLTLFKAFHIPFLLLLLILTIAPIFRYNYKKVVFALSLGGLSHIVSDLMLKSFGGGMKIFYPFSLEPFRLNWIWPDQSYLILIPTVLIYILIIIYKKSFDRPIIDSGQ